MLNLIFSPQTLGGRILLQRNEPRLASLLRHTSSTAHTSRSNKELEIFSSFFVCRQRFAASHSGHHHVVHFR